MRGLVERTRVAVVEVAAKGGSVTDGGSASQMDNDSMTNDDDGYDEKIHVNGNHGRWEMEIARVYERTISEFEDGFGYS